MQSKRRIRVVIAVCWCAALSAAMVEQILWNPAKSLDKSAAEIDFSKTCLTPPRRLKTYNLTLFLAVYFGPVIIVCILSIIFIFALRRRLMKTKRKVKASGINMQDISNDSISTLSKASAQDDKTALQPSSRSRYVKPAVTLFAIVLAMAICMLPYCFYVIVIGLICPECNNREILFNLLFLQFFNACLDPILYGITQRKIREFYTSCLFRSKPFSLNTI